jgi:hypothetical protein
MSGRIISAIVCAAYNPSGPVSEIPVLTLFALITLADLPVSFPVVLPPDLGRRPHMGSRRHRSPQLHSDPGGALIFVPLVIEVPDRSRFYVESFKGGASRNFCGSGKAVPPSVRVIMPDHTCLSQS